MSKTTQKKKSAPGSEPFMWKLWPEAPRVCSVCQRTLRVPDVRRHHTDYVDGRALPVQFFCEEHVLGRAA